MTVQTANYLKYLSSHSADEKWGIVCTTVGFQDVRPHMSYPVQIHPDDYNFTKNGRVLDEFQLVYIVNGSGYFQSDSVKVPVNVESGSMIMLFPGERHLYYPNPDVGWQEFWVGFKSLEWMDTVLSAFFSPREPIFRVGVRESLAELYNKIIGYSKIDTIGCQQVIGGIIFHILGRIYYEKADCTNRTNKSIEKINQAQILLRNNLSTHLSPEDIARRLNMSYSSLRTQFKAVTGMSMSYYQQQLKLNLAKELLSSSTKNISEIAYETGFESVSRFCYFFRKNMQITASEFRAKNSIIHKIRSEADEE